ncbi:hypothetical protein CAJAP_07626 [Camponotus japonicus]
MDALKERRKALRIAFTKALTAFSTRLESDCSREEKIVAFQFLETKMTELDAVHSVYNETLFESEADETDINRELESGDVYKIQYLTAKMKISKITPSTSDNISRMVSTNTLKTSKLPKLKLSKFGGNIKDWLLL